MKVSQIDNKIYTDFFNKHASEQMMYAHPLWFYGMSRDPIVLGAYNDQNELLVVWPFNIVKRFMGLECLSQPPFCQSLGPIFSVRIFKNRSNSSANGLVRQLIKKLVQYIDSQKFSCLLQGLPVTFKSPQVFHHYGFRLNYRITYRIASNTTPQKHWELLHSDHRRKIKKVKKQFSVSNNISPEVLWNLKKNVLSKSQLKNYPSCQSFCRAINELCSGGLGHLWGVPKKKEGYHSLGFFGEDKSTVYYLVGYTEKSSGSLSFSLPLLWKGISYALENNKNFDFEGTMVSHLDRNFRRFAPKAVPYARLEWSRGWLNNVYTLRHIRRQSEKIKNA